MAGALLMVGMNQLSLEELQKILKGESETRIMTAPASGLILHRIKFKE
jgi:tRNA U38,U39,U40 pseudouridine synthase TruA